MGTPEITSIEIINVSTLHSNGDIILVDTKRQRVTKTKFLGVIIDANLTWKNHIDRISKTISKNTGVINKVKYFMPERVLYKIYCTLVLPYVNHWILVWGSACKTYLEKLFKLQKWAVRTISESQYRSHSEPLFYKSEILNIYNVWTRSWYIHVHFFLLIYYQNRLIYIFSLSDLTFITITQEIIAITTKIGTRKYLLNKHFEQPDQFCGMLLITISKTWLQLNS